MIPRANILRKICFSFEFQISKKIVVELDHSVPKITEFKVVGENKRRKLWHCSEIGRIEDTKLFRQPIARACIGRLVTKARAVKPKQNKTSKRNLIALPTVRTSKTFPNLNTLFLPRSLTVTPLKLIISKRNLTPHMFRRNYLQLDARETKERRVAFVFRSKTSEIKATLIFRLKKTKVVT